MKMKNPLIEKYEIDHIEIYTPMLKPMLYWHVQGLGFSLEANLDEEKNVPGKTSYLISSGNIRLLLTSSYPTINGAIDTEINSFISRHHVGVKRIVLKTDYVREAFEASVGKGAVPVQMPQVKEDKDGLIEEAVIKLFDNSEIVFLNRSRYKGVFKPGYKKWDRHSFRQEPIFDAVDHIAGEVRINESEYWTNYLERTIGTSVVQRINRSAENRTGMILQISQSAGKSLTFVIAEPESYSGKSKVQENIDQFGPGIHHLAFATDDIIAATKTLEEKGIEFVSFPSAYYDLLRKNEELKGFDIDTLQELNILIDKEDDCYLLQKFIKPIGDRPFFNYEMVQRVNGYDGFALKNINVLANF
jgi:4-hydroxyphenylpyruvate dioxygenase